MHIGYNYNVKSTFSFTAAFEILVVRAPWTSTKKVPTKTTGAVVRWTTIDLAVAKAHVCMYAQVWTTKNLDGQPEIVIWLSVGHRQSFIFPYFEHWS